MKEKIIYWIDLSDYDVETAAAMQKSGRFLYVGFMCHQAIEKIHKAYYVFITADTPPHSHSLAYLAKKSQLYDLFTLDQQEFIDMLEPLQIEARYPSHKEQILKSLTEERCETILTQTKELQQWIKMKL